eukprot:c28608_g1_i1 orf=3100-5007(+)
MDLREGMSANIALLGMGKIHRKGGFRTVAKFSPMNNLHGKQDVEILFTPCSCQLVAVHTPSILLFASALKTVGTLIGFRCQVANNSSFLRQSSGLTNLHLEALEMTRQGTGVKERHRIFAKELELGIISVKSTKDLKSGRKKRRSKVDLSRILCGRLSSEGNGAVKARLKQVGITSPAVKKYLEQVPGLTGDDIRSSATSLMKIMGLGKMNAYTLLAKCSSLFSTDPQELKDNFTFLKELGIDRDDLSKLLLSHPTLLAHDGCEMRKLVEYLISEGIPKEGMPGIFLKRPQTLSYKVEQVRITVKCFLEGGVPSNEMTGILKNVPDLFSPSTQKNLKPRIQFFKDIGLEGKSFAKSIARRPGLLTFDLERMLRTQRYLQEFMSPEDVGKVVRRFAEVLSLDPYKKMEPVVNHLLEVGVKRDNIGKVLLRRPQLLGYTVSGLDSTINYLRELGVRECYIGRVIYTAPQVLTLNTEEKLKTVVAYFRSIGLEGEGDMEKMLVRNAQLLCCSVEKNLKPKFDFFCKMGLSTKDIIKILVLFPSMFGQSIVTSLEPKYDYLINIMKRSPSEIVGFPQYFGYSLEKRIKPRNEKLAARGIKISLPSMLACVETDFHIRYLSRDPSDPAYGRGLYRRRFRK